MPTFLRGTTYKATLIAKKKIKSFSFQRLENDPGVFIIDDDIFVVYFNLY